MLLSVVFSRHVSLVVLSVVFIFARASANAQSDKCEERASTQADLNKCAATDVQEADAKLNKIYAQVMKLLNGDAKLRLRDAQRAWISFRDKECAFVSGAVEGGSVQPMVRDHCLAKLIDARTKQLLRYTECEEGDMSCPTK